MLMLLGLICRGVAFEFRMKSARAMPWWNRSFFAGSVVATFFQGVVLGNFVQGFAVAGRHFAGGSFDFIRPFPLLTGVGLLFGYTLLGSTWLVMKTQGEVQRKSRQAGVAAAVRRAGLHRDGEHLDAVPQRPDRAPLVHVASMAYLAPVPVVTALIAYATWHALRTGAETVPFLGAMGLFIMCYLGLGISLFPYVVPYSVTLWQAAASPNSLTFLLVGTMFLLPLVFLYTFWSYYVFRGKVRADAGYH